DGFDELVESYTRHGTEKGGYLLPGKREKLESEVREHFDMLSGGELTIAEDFNERLFESGLP
ncbi:MAG: hypothetical protein ABEJ72_05480, partial [Candidatus Aenigmatarchaeota archaeon]